MDRIAAARGANVCFRFDLIELRRCCTLRRRLAATIIIIIIIIIIINQMLSGSSQLSTTAERGNQIVEHSSDNETMFGSIRKLGGVAEQ